jgi:NAD(P)-dependent dehydrogenase (short-subunit alcohol dehydrogenase family)
MTNSVVAEAPTELLRGRTAVVTGAAQGIGFAIAQTLSSHGATVVIADIDRDAAQKAAVHRGGGRGLVRRTHGRGQRATG